MLRPKLPHQSKRPSPSALTLSPETLLLPSRPMKHYITPTNPMRAQFAPRAAYQARHFAYTYNASVATITLNRPERKNPLTFDSYAELRDLFNALRYATDVKAVVITGAGGNFCSGGDVHEIIGPLTKMTMPEMLEFTRMTGDLVKTIKACPQPVIAAIDGICPGAGAMIALAADLRLGTPSAKTAYLFTRVGLAGADMGACALLPRLIGQGRAAELLFTGRNMTAQEGLSWGFFNALHDAAELLAAAQAMAQDLADGPSFAHSMTKTMLHQEWAMTIDQAIEAEAQAQAICMQTQDFKRAYEAFAAKQKPVFQGD
jgi:enoyl-CoA hydratase/carnithine racemase